MAHTHDHDHDHEGYFIDQLFSIGLCGALGGIAVLMFFRKKMLAIILAAPFHPYVLAGGIALLVLVTIRAIALWKYAGEFRHDQHHHDGPCGDENCGHDHEHHHHDHEHHHHEPKGMALGLQMAEHEHAHQHEHHDHDHSQGHDHSHGGAPWRYTVLMLPVALFLLNLPNEIFSARFQAVSVEDGSAEQAAAVIGVLAASGGEAPLLGAALLCPRYGEGPVAFDSQGRPMVDLPELRFSELEQWAFDADQRTRKSGKSAAIVGKFISDGSGTSFSLVRYQMNCCAADAIPLKSIIMVSPTWQGERLESKSRQQKWVRVIGRIFYLKKRGAGDEYIPALLLFPDDKHPPDDLVEIVPPPANPYSN